MQTSGRTGNSRARRIFSSFQVTFNLKWARDSESGVTRIIESDDMPVGLVMSYYDSSFWDI